MTASSVSMAERGRVAQRMGSIAALVAIGFCAVLAIVFSSSLHNSNVELAAKITHKAKVSKGLGLKTSDMALLKGAIYSQEKDSHKTCLEMCTTEKCKSVCGASKAAGKAILTKFEQGVIKSKMDLSKSDEKLLQDAQKQQKHELLKACMNHCSTDACKKGCNAPKSAQKAHKEHRAGLSLPISDMKLLHDAEKQQNKEMARKEKARSYDLAALKKGGSMDMSSTDNINHQPADDGDGDWSPGMRSNAMKQLTEEREQAKATTRYTEGIDSDDSWSHSG